MVFWIKLSGTILARSEHGPVRFGKCNSTELLHTIGDLKIKFPELLQIFGSGQFGD